jgi:hypothetical protein
MRISSVREFRDNATTLLRSRDPILVMRRGRIAGIFFPRPESTLPLELKREFYATLSEQLAQQFRKRGITEKSLVRGFESWRKRRREARRRR